MNSDQYIEIARSIRKRILKMVYQAKVSHPGGSLSATDILVALYFEVLRIDITDPHSPNRDIFILSKGHAASAFYSVLVERGCLKEEPVDSFGQINSIFQVHPDMYKVAWAEISTGALGQGLSVGVGTALGARLSSSDVRTYVLLDDGECQEGQVWEAAMAVAHFRLNNLVVIVDVNKSQLLGRVNEIMSIDPIADKWKSFGWHVIEVDGHNIPELIYQLNRAKEVKDSPVAMIAHIIKGKGVSFMEGKGYAWHGRVPTEEEFNRAMAELEQKGVEVS